MKKQISHSHLKVGDKFEGKFEIPENKIEEYIRLFDKKALPFTPPFLIMIYSINPIMKQCSIVPGTIHASQTFEVFDYTREREFVVKGEVTDKFEKRGRKYIVFTLHITTPDGIKVAKNSFRFLVPE